MPYLGILGNKPKEILLFAISALKLGSFKQNVRNFNLGPKLSSLD